MADEQLWAGYSDRPYMVDSDILLVDDGSGGGINIPGSAILKKDAAGFFLCTGNLEIPSDTGTVFTMRYQSINEASRSWRMAHDVNAYGDFSIRQSTTQTGNTFADMLYFSASGNVLAGSDNTQTLGGASNRWSTVYAGTGTINTSDERSKTDIGAIPDEWLDAWADVQWQRFKFIGGTRWHTGLVAQQVHAAFAAHDLDAFEIGLCCFDEWEEETRPIYKTVKRTRKVKVEDGVTKAGKPKFKTATEEYEEQIDTGKTEVTLEAGDRWGLRYDECQAMEAAYQRRRSDRLEARLALLECGA